MAATGWPDARSGTAFQTGCSIREYGLLGHLAALGPVADVNSQPVATMLCDANERVAFSVQRGISIGAGRGVGDGADCGRESGRRLGLPGMAEQSSDARPWRICRSQSVDDGVIQHRL